MPRIRTSLPPLAAAALALLIAAATANAACRVDPRATVPITIANAQPVVTVALNDQPTPLLLDTGATRSLLTAAAVQRANLPLDAWVSTPLLGAGNVLENRRNVLLRSMALGGLPLRRRGIAQTISLAVTVERIDANDHIAGLLGADMLSRYDLELDFPAGRATLYTVTGCTGRFVPWAMQYDAIPATHRADDSLLVPVQIDGHKLGAELDTGAGFSLVYGRGLYNLGLTPEALAGDRVVKSRGIGGPFENQQHRFGELWLGSARIAAPTFHVARVPRPGVDMLLGMDVLASRRVWISYATSQVFIATRAAAAPRPSPAPPPPAP